MADTLPPPDYPAGSKGMLGEDCWTRAQILALLAAECERLQAEDAWRAGFDAGAIYGVAEDRYDPQRDPEHERPERPQNPYAA